MNELLIATLAIAFFVLLVVSIAHHAIYRTRFRFTEADLDRARREAVRGSHLTKAGQIAEHLAPFLPDFCASFNPKDARFLGHPVDFIVFDGLEEGEVQSVVLLEIKSGASSDLNTRQRQVRRAVDAGHVRFETMRVAALAQTAVLPR